jgi:two-component system, cell cycle sensor histidine kinase and response regulator CckA
MSLTSERTPPAPITVLVADDTRDAAIVVARLLEETGYAALCAHSAREALDLLDERGEIGLVLSDIRMPGIDGFDLLRVLRHRFPALPVILMTGLPVTEEDGAPSGIDVLQKPLDVTELDRLIKAKLAPKDAR